MIDALAAELGSARAALSLLCLRLGEAAGLLARGTCTGVLGGGSALRAARQLRARHFCSLAQCICLGRELSQHITLKHDGSFPQNTGYYAVVTTGAP